MDNFVVILKRKFLERKSNLKKEDDLKKLCLEQFEKLVSKGLTLPITLL